MGKSEGISEYQILENGRFGRLLQMNESSRLSDENIQEEKILLNIAPKRFKEGDIVEVRKEDHIELGIIHEAPQDSDRYKMEVFILSTSTKRNMKSDMNYLGKKICLSTNKTS